MAREGPPVPGPWLRTLSHEATPEQWRAQLDAERDALAALEREATAAPGLVGQLIRFPIADGFALYLVAREQPLTLRHVPHGDAYRIPAAHLRGLRLSDVRRMVEAERAMQRLFERARAAQGRRS